MNRIMKIIVVGGLVAATLATASPGGASEGAEAPTTVVASWEWGGDDAAAVAAIEDAAAHAGGEIHRINRVLDYAAVAVPANRTDRAIAELLRAPEIVAAELDRRLTLHHTPNDPFYTQQWGPPAIGMPTAWDAGTGSNQIQVGVIDTGVSSHPDLDPNVCNAGANFIDPGQPPADTHGHGTHVAGTVGADIDNAQGVAGMGDSCIVPIKVIDGHGRGSTLTLAQGIEWAADNGIEVVNMSLGSSSGTTFEERAVEYAWGKGVFLVAAAGNDTCKPVGFPAAYPEVIAVAALASSTTRASYSNCGPEVELSAPGSSVYSTDYRIGYSYKSGTSMASPHVAGVAGLLWDLDVSLTNAEMRCLLRDTADDLGPDGKDDGYGWGRVDADGALDRLTLGSVPAWPNCEGSPPTGETREVESTYITGNDAVIHCLSRVGGACFDIEDGDETVSIVVDDIFIEPVPGFYRFRDAAGNDLGSGAFCVSAEQRAVPTGATTLYVYAGGPLRAALECGAPTRTSTLGFIRVTFNG